MIFEPVKKIEQHSSETLIVQAGMEIANSKSLIKQAMFSQCENGLPGYPDPIYFTSFSTS